MYKILKLKVKSEGIRSVAGVVSSPGAQVALGLFDGVTVEAHVYSGTNKCFSMTEEMIRDAWKNLDKETFWWITEKDIDNMIRTHTKVNEHGNTLAMCLPCLHCESTPAEIEEMLALIPA
jgi:hypothetical protein